MTYHRITKLEFLICRNSKNTKAMALEYNLPLAQNDNEQWKSVTPSQAKKSKMKLKILQQNSWVKIIKGCIQIFELSLQLDVRQYHEQEFYIRT